jgi:uncharacterized protein YcbX
MKITQLYVYPIKSLRPTVLESAEATYRGFQYDRRFLLVKTFPQKKNMHISDFPEMCLFLTSIVYPTKGNPSGGIIIVTHVEPGSTNHQILEVPLRPETSVLSTMGITMHSSPTNGYDMGPHYNQWFSKCFGYEVVLLYLGENRREVLGNMSPAVTWKQQQQQSWMSNLVSRLPVSGDVPGVDEGIGFADVAPYLVVTERSWKDASARLPESEPLDITKFRPNIVVQGADKEFEEDYWAELAIGESLKIVLTQNCARCRSINVDYATGKPATSEAGSILKRLQKDRRVDPGSRYSPIFGRYGFLDKAMAGSTMRVGDEVKVLKTNKERSIFGEYPLFFKNFAS